MARRLLNMLQMPDGNIYELYGWYGECRTTATDQVKNVTIDGFSSESLATGVRVTIKFTSGQGYNGIPYLIINNISSSYKPIYSTGTSRAGLNEWAYGEIVSFIYSGTSWIIEHGGRATDSYYGRTKLSYAVGDDSDMAITPYGVLISLQSISTEWMWDGQGHQAIELVNTTTPAVWNIDGDWASCELSYSNIYSALNNTRECLRLIRVTFGDYVLYAYIDYSASRSSIELYYDDSIYISVGDISTYITVDSSIAGAYPFKVELYTNGGANIVTYPMLKDQGYLTLADLPIYDGSVT